MKISGAPAGVLIAAASLLALAACDRFKIPGGQPSTGGGVAGAQSPADQTAAMAAFRALPKPAACGRQRVLVLYSRSGEWGRLGELYGLFTANLAGRYADADLVPITAYEPGSIDRHALTVFVGSSYGEPQSEALRKDLAATSSRVLWLAYGLNELSDADPGFAKRYGFKPGDLDHGRFDRVDYHGTALTRRGDLAGELATETITDPKKVEVLATATRSDGEKLPWAIRSGNLTFVGENPYSYMGEDDRYLAYADILAGLLAPRAPDRHRAMVRIEDVGPDANPAALRALADYLKSRGAPFSVAVYDSFEDPNATVKEMPRHATLADRPQVAEALKYMVSRGGSLIMHGHTHQLDALNNPYSGKSAADFEFFRAHVDEKNAVRYDGPVAQDSLAWAGKRMDDGLAVWASAGLPKPTIFEFPHYGASALDYAASAQRFPARYERSMYFSGSLAPAGDGPVPYEGQFFPYPVRDLYGQVVIPENMGNLAREAFNQNAARTPAQLVETAKRDLVLKDGFASFFYHWFLGTDQLRQIVEPMQAQGWTFTDPASVIAETRCGG